VITTANTLISAKTVNCPLLDIRANNVNILNSKVNGAIRWFSGFVVVNTSEVNGGNRQDAAISCENGSLVQGSNVYGGHASVQSDGGCTVRDSWLHLQGFTQAGAHLNGFLSNGGSGMVIDHNTLECRDPTNDGGCTGPFALFGDFNPISDVTVNNNLFVGQWRTGFTQAFCAYFGEKDGTNKLYDADHVRVTNNVFQYGQTGDRNLKRCGYYGASTAYGNGVGNQWSNNKWEDGKVLNPNV
jgi:hypothetical protein